MGRLTGSRKVSVLQKEAVDKQLELIRRSLDGQSGNGQLQFPLVIIRAQDFLNWRGLMSYEDLRRSGQLIIIDTLSQLKQFERKQRIVFFSHRTSLLTTRVPPPAPTPACQRAQMAPPLGSAHEPC